MVSGCYYVTITIGRSTSEWHIVHVCVCVPPEMPGLKVLRRKSCGNNEKALTGAKIVGCTHITPHYAVREGVWLGGVGEKVLLESVFTSDCILVEFLDAMNKTPAVCMLHVKV